MQKGIKLTKIPTVNMESQNMTVTLLIKFLTCDDVNVLKHDHPEMTIKIENSIKRTVLNWWRKKKGSYTQETELGDAKFYADLEDEHKKKGKGIFCNACMEIKHEQNYLDARMTFDGFAEFSTFPTKTA